MTPKQERQVNRDEEQGLIIHEKVKEFHTTHPRSKKNDQDIADEIIKNEARNLFPYKGFSEDTQAWLRNMSITGVKILEDGYLEVRRWDNTGQHFGKPKKMTQRVNDINAAIRMQEHILEGYVRRTDDREVKDDDESVRLDSIEEVIEEANSLFLEWKFAEPEEKEDMKQRLARVILMLEKCRNEFKVRTHEQTRHVLRMKDSKGRENPGALAARTVSALNNLEKRLQEIQDIAPKVALRKELLVLEKRRNERLCFKAVAKLRFILRHVFFSRNSLSIRDADVIGLTGKVREAKDLLREVVVSPYKEHSDQALFFLATLEDAMGTRESMREHKDDIKKLLLDSITILGD